MQWIYENHKEYAIRIINISLGADELGFYKESSVDKLAEALITESITIFAPGGSNENKNIHQLQIDWM